MRAFDGRDGELLRPLRARGAPQPRARRRAGPAVQPQQLRARGAGPPGRALAHARAGVRVGELPRHARCATARSRRPTRACSRAPCSASTTASGTGTGPNGIIALDRIADYYTELALAMIGLPPAARRAGARRGMSFFERYFEALDGPEPYSSLDLVSDDVEFAIEWAAGEDRKATQLRGGKAELRAFIDAGDMDGWAHYVVWSATRRRHRVRARRDALGRRPLHRHLPGGRPPRRRRAHGPLHGRPLARDPVPRARCPMHPELLAGHARASRCCSARSAAAAAP